MGWRGHRSKRLERQNPLANVWPLDAVTMMVHGRTCRLKPQPPVPHVRPCRTPSHPDGSPLCQHVLTVALAALSLSGLREQRQLVVFISLPRLENSLAIIYAQEQEKDGIKRVRAVLEKCKGDRVGGQEETSRN